MTTGLTSNNELKSRSVECFFNEVLYNHDAGTSNMDLQ